MASKNNWNNPGTSMKLKDNQLLGLVLALVLPVFIFFGIYLVRFSAYPLHDFWNVLQQENRLVTFFVAWCLVGNIALFTLFINSRKDRTAKGIFIVTVAYGALFLLLQWLL